MKRRTFLSLTASAVAAGVAGLGYRYWPDEGLLNPCLEGTTPDALLNHELVQRAWEGLRPGWVWDCHTHVIGAGDTDSGIRLHKNMQKNWYPAHNLRYRFYMNATCTVEGQPVDTSVMERLKRLYDDFLPGARFMLLAFEAWYDEKGKSDPERTPFFIPNAYAERVASLEPSRLGWIASIHPYRQDCVEALQEAVQNGARAIKWLPPVMGMDPSSPLCDRFYDALIKRDIPILTHAGHEYAVAGVDAQHLGNPLLLRRPLERGVKVIVAHCASEGRNVDIDKSPRTTNKSNFALFARLMDEKQYEKNLIGEISAITQKH